MTNGIGLVDESWFLQVVDRINSGDVLYRDVFFGATPLSVYLTSALTRVAGIEVVAVKIVTNACFAATTLLAGRIAVQVGLSRAAAFVLVAMLMVLARPYAMAPYTPLAFTLFMATVASALTNVCARNGHAAKPNSRPHRDLATGALAGLSFAAKQNVGLLALAAALAAVPVASLPGEQPGRTWRRAALITAGFWVAAGVSLLPVGLSGALPGLWEYGFAGKGAYLRLGGLSYFDSLGAWLGSVSDLPAPSAALTLLQGTILALPLILVLVTMARIRALDPVGRVLVLFALAATMSALPRWGRSHVSHAAPALLVALMYAIRLPDLPSVRRARSSPLAPWTALVACVSLLALQPAVSLARGEYQASALPHFRGVGLANDEERVLAEAATDLAAEAGGRPLFVLSLEAGFLYLTSGVRNPTQTV